MLHISYVTSMYRLDGILPLALHLILLLCIGLISILGGSICLLPDSICIESLFAIRFLKSFYGDAMNLGLSIFECIFCHIKLLGFGSRCGFLSFERSVLSCLYLYIKVMAVGSKS